MSIYFLQSVGFYLHLFGQFSSLVKQVGEDLRRVSFDFPGSVNFLFNSRQSFVTKVFCLLICLCHCLHYLCLVFPIAKFIDHCKLGARIVRSTQDGEIFFLLLVLRRFYLASVSGACTVGSCVSPQSFSRCGSGLSVRCVATISGSVSATRSLW